MPHSSHHEAALRVLDESPSDRETRNRLEGEIERLTQHLSSRERKRIYDAMGFARMVHKGTRRADGSAYIVHVLEATENLLLFQVDDPHPADLVIATLLHDSIEENRPELARLAHAHGGRSRHGDNTHIVKYLGIRFTPRAAAIIQAESRAPYPEGISRDELGELYREHIEISLHHPDPGVFVVKLADYLHNVTHIRGIQDTPSKPGWLRQRDLARKWLNVFPIFLERLWEDDIRMPHSVKQAVDARLREAWDDAISIDSETRVRAEAIDDGSLDDLLTGRKVLS